MTTPSGRARPLPPEERREALINATVPLLRRHGREVSTRQIAEAACVAEGTIFRAFEDKASLIGAAIQRAFDPADALAALAKISRELPLDERMVEAAKVLKKRLSGVFNLLDAVGHGSPPNIKWRPVTSLMGDDELAKALVDLIADDASRLRLDPVEVSRILRWLVFTSSHPRLAEGSRFDPELIVSIVLDGVRRPRPSTRVSTKRSSSGKERSC